MSRAPRRWPSDLPTAVVLPRRNEAILPAELADDDNRFGDALVELIVERLTAPGDVVFDPFCGLGTTVRVAERLMREAWGVEIDPARAEFARTGMAHPERLLLGDARRLGALDLPPFRLLLTSPPYPSPGDAEDALTGYTTPGRGYSAYLDDLSGVFAESRRSATDDGWIVVEASNLKDVEGRVTTLAWDLAATVSSVARFLGEMVVAWEPTYGYGYDHSYCLVFAPS